MSTLLECKDLTKCYGKKTAIDHINLAIESGHIIGLLGPNGSGKTTLTERLRDHFGADEVSVLNHDSYYKRHDDLPFEERCKLNYDHPDAFDNALLIYHLQELKAGRAIDCPVYDYADHNRSNEVQHILSLIHISEPTRP